MKYATLIFFGVAALVACGGQVNVGDLSGGSDAGTDASPAQCVLGSVQCFAGGCPSGWSGNPKVVCENKSETSCVLSDCTNVLRCTTSIAYELGYYASDPEAGGNANCDDRDGVQYFEGARWGGSVACLRATCLGTASCAEATIEVSCQPPTPVGNCPPGWELDSEFKYAAKTHCGTQPQCYRRVCLAPTYTPDTNSACGTYGGQCGDYRNAFRACGQPGMSELPNASGAPVRCNTAYETCCAPDRCTFPSTSCKDGTACILAQPRTSASAQGLCLRMPQCDVNALCAPVSNGSVHACGGFARKAEGVPRGVPIDRYCANIPDACVAGGAFPTCACILKELNDPLAQCTTDVNGWPILWKDPLE